LGGATGDRSTSRRKKRRGAQALSPSAAGELLRSAREQAGIDLAEVHDRTGISWRNLEALESGDVQRFSGSAATIAVRRYAELVSLDPAPLVSAFATPAYALAGSPGATGVSWPRTPEEPSSGHLRRYHPDHSHLRSFTQTAPVPATPGAAGDPNGSGGRGQPERRRKKAPWALRFFTWLALLLLVVGSAGIAVDKYKPQWLRDIHVLKPLAARAPSSRSASRSASHKPPTKKASTRPGPVTTSTVGFGSVDVKVAASTYTIVVSASDTCWVGASTPLDVNPIVDKTLLAGQSVSIKATTTQLTFEVGSLAANFTVQIDGKTVSGWSLRPDSVPFYATFSSD